MQRILAFLAISALVAACGNDNGPTDSGTTPDVDVASDTVDVEPDTPEPDAEEDPFEFETGPPPCQPGVRRCLGQAGVQAYELCNDGSEWDTFFCEDGEVCFNGECQSQICEPFTVDSCVDCRTYAGCNSGGTAIEEDNFVPFDRTCLEIDGVAQLVPSVCTPDATRCMEDNPNAVEVCDQCGQEWSLQRDCFEEDETTVCDLGECITQCEFIRKRKTYIGCEYWAVDLDNAFVPAGGGQYIDADGQPFAIVLSNPNEELDAEVEISMVDGPVWNGTIPPGGLETAEMHFYSSAADRTGIPLADLQGTVIDAQAFRVESNIPIIAYQFNPLDNEEVFSNDASLLFPTSSLGSDYWIMTRRQTFDSLKGYLTVAATQPGETIVTVTLPEYTPENPVITLSGVNIRTSESIPPMRGGDSMTFTLQQYDVLNIETDREGADLTGAFIDADRNVAVFAGSEASNAPNDDSCVYRPSFDDWVCEATRRTFDPIPCTNDAGEPDITRCGDFITCCADHIEHQMLPDFTWGRRFNATRSAPRGDEADSWRILASEDGTRVNLIGLPDTWPLPGLIPSLGNREFDLDAGEWVDFQSPVDFEISATEPIMVGQFLQAEFAPYPRSIDAEQPPHEDAGTGDPAFILGVPAEQYRQEYTFLAPDAFEFDYVLITAPVGADVFIDDEQVDSDEFVPFGSGDFASARLLIEDGVHTLVASEPVGLVVHGYDSFVSYGYPAGLDLVDISGGR